MKHTLQVTLLLIAVFLLIQFFGLFALSQNTVVSVSPEGNVTVEHNDTVVGERPPIEGWVSIAYVLFGILVGTGLILLFARFGQFRLWKIMYFMAIWLSSSITLGVFVGAMAAMTIALLMAIIDIYVPNVLVHNLVEIFIYPGIAILFVPLLSVFWAGTLLFAISIYDMFAVWKSKHMITLAKFQTSSRSFAGFVIPYGKSGGVKGIKKGMPKKIGTKGSVKTAILGGGDIAFPLLFAGVVMDWLIGTGMSKYAAFLQASVVSIFAAAALLILFMKAEKNKFYPAMPFISAGCFAGLIVIYLISLI